MPLLLKTPLTLVDIVMWLNQKTGKLDISQNASAVVMEACTSESEKICPPESEDVIVTPEEYEYAYWLGYIYRCESLLHDESSRMVHGAFREDMMRKFYEDHKEETIDLDENAVTVCHELDQWLLEELWKEKEKT